MERYIHLSIPAVGLVRSTICTDKKGQRIECEGWREVERVGGWRYEGWREVLCDGLTDRQLDKVMRHSVWCYVGLLYYVVTA